MFEVYADCKVLQFLIFKIPDYICKPMKSGICVIMVRSSVSGFLGPQLLLR